MEAAEVEVAPTWVTSLAYGCSVELPHRIAGAVVVVLPSFLSAFLMTNC